MLHEVKKASEYNGSSISLRNQNLFWSKSRDLRAQYQHQAWDTSQNCVSWTASGGVAEAEKVTAAVSHLSHLLKEAI